MHFNRNYIQSNTFIKLFSLLILLVSFNAKSAEVSELVGNCTQAINKGDYDAAIKTASELLKQAPNNRDGFLCKGRALGAKGQASEALSALESAAKNSEPGFDELITYIFIGNLHKTNHKNTEAIAAYSKSMAICDATKNEKYKRINLNLTAEAQTQNKDLNGALASNLAGSKFAMNDNERADSLERVAATYKALGEYDLAIENQLKGVNMQKKAGTLDQYANANLALGDIYVAAKDYTSAENTFSNLAKFSNDQGGAYYEAKADIGLAQTKAASGDTTAAKVFADKAKRIAKDTNDNALMKEVELAIK